MQGSVRKRGDKWYYSFELAKIDGSRKRVERVGGRTKKEALAAMRKSIEGYESAGKMIDESSMSVADYLDYWYENYVKVSLRYNSQRTYKNGITRIKNSIGSYHLKKLSPAAIQKFLNEMHMAGYARGTIQNTRMVLVKALNMAVNPYRFIQDNPGRYATVPKAAKNRDGEDVQTFSKEDIKKLFNLFPRGSRYHVPIIIGYHTGLRMSEITGLTWDCIDLKAKTLSVKKIQIYKTGEGYFLEPPKTPSSIRTISIGNQLHQSLMDHKLDQKKNILRYGPYYKNSDYVCTDENGQSICLSAMKSVGDIVKRNLGFTFSFHRLRHTHATMLLATGVSMKAIQLRLGHANITTTMNIYAHHSEDLEKTTAAHLEALAIL